jgi:hypothetical protein
MLPPPVAAMVRSRPETTPAVVLPVRPELVADGDHVVADGQPGAAEHGRHERRVGQRSPA